MPNDKELYLRMFRASEQAVRLLTEAQQECEERYCSQEEPELILLARQEEKTEGES